MTTQSGKLFLVAGASASGKSTTVAALAAMDKRFVVHQKGTTRQIRADDTDVYHDPRLLNLSGNEDMVVYLGNGGSRYGIDLRAIRRDLGKGLNVLIVCVDHGATEQLREIFPGQVVVAFIHRDLTPTMERTIVERDPKGGLKRLVARARMYDQLAAGLYRPDYIVLNVGALEHAVEQLRRIAAATVKPLHPGEAENTMGVLHLVISPSGRLKDAIEEVGVWTYPGWGESFIQKDVHRMQSGEQAPCPAGSIRYSFFGKEFTINVSTVMERLARHRVAFITVADIASARRLQTLVEQAGYQAHLHYLHQEPEEIRATVKTCPRAEWKPRLEQARMLLRQYQEELILETHPLLPVNGEENVVAWVQKCIRDRPR